MIPIRSLLVLPAAYLFGALCCMAQQPELSADEKAANWKLLFDGTPKGWHSVGRNEFPKQGWMCENGELKLVKTIGITGGGDIVTEEMFDNFELVWEWKIAADGNSGVKYNLPNPNKNVGFEYQLLDDEKNHDAKVHEGTHSACALYDMFAPNDKKKLKPVGEWNSSRIVFRGNHIEHWLNGEMVMTCEIGSEAFNKAKSESKFKNVPGWGEKMKSPILLQDHDGEISFRNIKIRPLE